MGNGESTHKSPILDDKSISQILRNMTYTQKVELFEKDTGKQLCYYCRKEPEGYSDSYRRKSNMDFHSTAKHEQNSQSASKFRSATKSFSHQATNQDPAKGSWLSSFFSAAGGNKIKYAICKECRVEFKMNVEEHFEKCEK